MQSAIRSYFKEHPDIVYDNEILGGFDFEIEVQVPSLNDLRQILSEMKQKYANMIKNYTYMLFYKEHKYVFFPLYGR